MLQSLSIRQCDLKSKDWLESPVRVWKHSLWHFHNCIQLIMDGNTVPISVSPSPPGSQSASMFMPSLTVFVSELHLLHCFHACPARNQHRFLYFTSLWPSFSLSGCHFYFPQQLVIDIWSPVDAPTVRPEDIQNELEIKAVSLTEIWVERVFLMDNILIYVFIFFT